MKDIDFLEHGGASSSSFALRLHGESYWMPDPREQHYQWVLMTLHVGHVPGTPDGIPDWQRRLVFDRWVAAWELPDFDNARRLAYLVDNYRPAISNDLQIQAGLDLGELWRARRWRLLLDLIDRFPAHSWYASSVSMDENHARMMADALMAQEKDDDKPSGPSLTTWTPEVAALTNILDAVRSVQHAVVAVQAPRDKQPSPPKPSPRPVTPLEKAMRNAEYRRRKQAHESLVARVLPHKSRGDGQVH